MTGLGIHDIWTLRPGKKRGCRGGDNKQLQNASYSKRIVSVRTKTTEAYLFWEHLAYGSIIEGLGQKAPGIGLNILDCP
jgi:hypothetical protein